MNRQPRSPDSSIMHVLTWQFLCDMNAARHQSDEPTVLPEIVLPVEEYDFTVGGELPEAYMQHPIPARQKSAIAGRLFQSIMTSLIRENPSNPVDNFIVYSDAVLQRLQPDGLAQPDGSFSAIQILPPRDTIKGIYDELFDHSEQPQPIRGKISQAMTSFIIEQAALTEPNVD